MHAIYDMVRVTKLLSADRDYHGTEGVKRTPEVDDIATIVDYRGGFEGEEFYTVECCDENGFTIWLADFRGDELTQYEFSKSS
jgi:hypothetical protein